MRANNELKVLLAGPALAGDKALRKRLSGDYGLAMADTLECAARVIESGEVDGVVSEQHYEDGRGSICCSACEPSSPTPSASSSWQVPGGRKSRSADGGNSPTSAVRLSPNARQGSESTFTRMERGTHMRMGSSLRPIKPSSLYMSR
jgi:hypothetical protein